MYLRRCPPMKTPACAAILLTLACCALGHAATFSVTDTRDLPDNNLADPACRSSANTCTLRAAVDQANANRNFDSINIRAGIYDLTRGHLTILTPMSLRGVTEDETVIRKGEPDPNGPS